MSLNDVCEWKNNLSTDEFFFPLFQKHSNGSEWWMWMILLNWKIISVQLNSFYLLSLYKWLCFTFFLKQSNGYEWWMWMLFLNCNVSCFSLTQTFTWLWMVNLNEICVLKNRLNANEFLLLLCSNNHLALNDECE